MATIGEIARISTAGPGEPGDLINSAWLVWQRASSQMQRRGVRPVNGFYRYEGTMRTHVLSLWPTMDSEERNALEKMIYRVLRELNMAKCIHRQNPVIWQISESWVPSGAIVVPIHSGGFQQTHAERKLTPHEAGEDRSPQPVTVRHKETPTEMTSNNPADALLSSQEQRREEMLARRALIADYVQKEIAEPVTVDEVAHAFNVSSSAVRSDLADLVERRVLFTRPETTEERSVRYGDVAFARKAALYWGKSNIPERTMREVVEGFTVAKADREPHMSPHEVNRRIWCQLKRKGPRSRFTALDIADKAGVKPEVVRNRFREFEKSKWITKVGADATNRVIFAVKNLEAIREHLGQPLAETIVDTPEEAQQPKAKVTTPAVPTPPAEDVNLIHRAGEILAENTRLRDAVAELRAELATALQKIEELEARPAIDPATAAALQNWTPSDV